MNANLKETTRLNLQAGRLNRTNSEAMDLGTIERPEGETPRVWLDDAGDAGVPATSSLLSTILENREDVAQTGVADNDDTWRIALSHDMPGRKNPQGAFTFAHRLYGDLTSAGGEAHLVSYEWRDEASQIARGCCVVFRSSNGVYYIFDNMMTQPLEIEGGEPRQWLQYLVGHPSWLLASYRASGFKPEGKIQTRLVYHETSTKNFGCFASLRRDTPLCSEPSGWE